MLNLLSLALTLFGLAADPATVTGTWQMGLQGDHVVPVALVLKQEGTHVAGKILMPSSNGERHEVELAGQFVDGRLSLASTEEVTLRSRDGESKTTLKLSGKLEDDGSLSGTFMDHMPWTAERLKEKK